MDVKKQAVLLNKECNRLAEEAEGKLFEPENTIFERERLQETARVYRLMAETHLRTALHAEQVRPEKFNRKNTGQQNRTRDRLAYAMSLSERYEIYHHGSLAQQAKEDFQNSRLLWPEADTPEALADKVTSFLKNHFRK